MLTLFVIFRLANGYDWWSRVTPVSSTSTEPCPFAGHWRNEYAMTISIQQTSEKASGVLTIPPSATNRGGRIPFTGVIKGKVLSATYNQIETPEPKYRNGGKLTFEHVDCNTLPVKFLNQWGGSLHSDLIFKRE